MLMAVSFLDSSDHGSWKMAQKARSWHMYHGTEDKAIAHGSWHRKPDHGTWFMAQKTRPWLIDHGTEPPDHGSWEGSW